VVAGATGLTVAVKVTLEPCTDGFAEETSVVAELAGWTASIPSWSDLRFLRKRAASDRKFSSLEMDVIPLAGQEGDRA